MCLKFREVAGLRGDLLTCYATDVSDLAICNFSGSTKHASCAHFTFLTHNNEESGRGLAVEQPVCMSLSLSMNLPRQCVPVSLGALLRVAQEIPVKRIRELNLQPNFSDLRDDCA